MFINSRTAMWLLCLSALFTSSCETPCEYEVLSSLPSPDKTKKAVLFSRNCGATTGYNLRVTVAINNSRFDSTGNVLVAEPWAKSWDPLPGSLIRMKWAGTNTLQISASTVMRFHKRKEKIDDTLITYMKLAEPKGTSEFRGHNT